MPGRQDFYITIEHAAGSTLEATCAARTAAASPLPQSHRRLLSAAIRKLEGAQDDLFKLRNDPWGTPPARRNQQLGLELAA